MRTQVNQEASDLVAKWIKEDFPELLISSVPYDTYQTPRGTPFVTLCSGGIKPEGEPVPLLCLTAELAEAYYWQSLRNYIKANLPGKLCWRTRPVIQTVVANNITRYFIWSRLCIEKETANEDQQKL